MDEQKRTVQARGGLHNVPLINWEIDREVQFGISNGVLSPKSWALLSNSKLANPKTKSVQCTEKLDIIEHGEYCYVDLKYCPNCVDRLGAQPNPCNQPLPMGRVPELMLKPLPPSKTKWIFIYDNETGERIRDFQIINTRIFFQQFHRQVTVDYTFNYEDRIQVIEVGNRLLNGFLRLDGKVSVKDEKNGRVTTGILEMPKIKLSSKLSLRLGKNYDSSVVSDFYFTAYPDDSMGRKESAPAAMISFLDTELTGEYI